MSEETWRERLARDRLTWEKEMSDRRVAADRQANLRLVLISVFGLLLVLAIFLRDLS